MRVEHLRAPSVRGMFGDERASETALAFLRDTWVGCVVTIASPDEGK